MKRVIPEPTILESSRLSSPQPSTHLKGGMYAGHLLKKYAANVLLVTAAKDLLYVGEHIMERLSIPQGATNLEAITDNYLSALLDKGLQTVEASMSICQFSQVPIHQEKSSPLADFKFEPVSVHEQKPNVIEIEILVDGTIGNESLADRELQKLQRENTFLDAFVQGASHDLNGSLVVFKSFIDLFRKYTSEEKKENALQFMKETSVRMERILRGFSDLVNYQKRRKRKLDRLMFETQMSSTLLQLGHKMADCDPIIQTDFSQVPHINYFKAYLNSIFYNLLSNAIKYRREGIQPKIELRTYADTDYIVLEVQDNGIGINMKECSHLLFEPFQRFCPEREGTGIGLSFIHKIVVEHGGYIKVDSQLGKGSTFSVYLKNLEN
ncbi:MAG: HAMP domain-containing sensor histidine kinase [Bacteroidota bacterium]